jgi:hypothetical protein
VYYGSEYDKMLSKHVAKINFILYIPLALFDSKLFFITATNTT